MLPLLKREIVDNRGWATEDELLDYYAVGQCTPGIIAVNTSTFIGYKEGGVLGAVAATAGMVTPSVIIITIIAAFLANIMGDGYVERALRGVRAIVCALMGCTVFTLAKKSVKDALCMLLLAAAAATAFFTPFPTVGVVVIAALIGILARRGRA